MDYWYISGGTGLHKVDERVTTMDNRWQLPTAMVAAMTASVLGLGLVACGAEEAATPAPAPAPAPVAEPEAPKGPLPAIMMVQAWFKGGKPAPAKMVVWRTDGEAWFDETITDKDSSVFHKAVAFEDGILTIAAGAVGKKPPAKAKLSHWTRSDDGWKEEILWGQAWAGKFQRLRDFELGDLDGDGQDEIAIATHDQGVVAVADRGADGKWTVAEYDETPDIFVHEIEIGDVDGDGVKEFYATPSDRNKSSGESQKGGVVRYDHKDGKYVRSEVAFWDESHAKEILVSDQDGDGKDELYAVREAHIIKDEEGNKKRETPVKIIQFSRDGAKWSESLVAELDDDQCRFLVSGDLDGDGKTDLLAAGYKSGLWFLKQKADGSYENVLIDAKSGGFEHASHVADLDGDGKVEIYVASDEQGQFRRYQWNGQGFDRKVIAKIPSKHITWNLQDGKL